MFSNGVISTNRVPAGSGASTFGSSFGQLGYQPDPTGNDFNSLSAAQVAGPNPFTQSLNPLGASFNIAPRYLPSPLKVIVSPHVGYRTATASGGSVKVADVIMADSQNCGLLMTKEGVSIDEWRDPEVDMRAMKIKERWGMALLSQGKGVAVARDMVIADNHVFDNVNQVTLANETPSATIVS